MSETLTTSHQKVHIKKDHLTPADTACITGVTKIMKVVGSKWTLFILHALCERTKRFGELQKELTGISPRTLSLRLQQLEKDGIVKKHVFAEVPPHVEYSLTKKGASLKHIIVLMDQWGDQN